MYRYSEGGEGKSYVGLLFTQETLLYRGIPIANYSLEELRAIVVEIANMYPQLLERHVSELYRSF